MTSAGNIRRWFTGFLMIFIFLSILPQCGRSNNDRSPHLELGDTLRVGIELSPMTISTMADTIQGFSYDILNYLVNQHNVNYKLNGYHSMKEALEDLRHGRIDMLVSNLPLSTSLKEEFLATRPLYTDRIVLVQNSEGDTLIEYPHELADMEVWVPRETSVTDRLKNLSDEIGADIIINDSSGYSEEQLVILVALGEIPRAAVGGITASNLAEYYPQLDNSTDLSFSQFKCWLIAPGDSMLCDTIDTWLDQLMVTPYYKKLKKKYKL